MSDHHDKIIDRIRKLLALTKSANEHEAAAAGARAAQLMREHEIGEAMLRVSDDTATAEPIIEGRIDDTVGQGKRVAWQLFIAHGAGLAFDVRNWSVAGRIEGMGRASAVSAWNYTCMYLFNEVNRLADAAWSAYPTTLDRAGNARAWKNAFRVGAATVIYRRLKTQAETSAATERVDVAAATASASDAGQALAIIARDHTEVEAAYAARSKGFSKGTPVGHTSSGAGYRAGRDAGERVSLGGGGRGLSAPKQQIARDSR